MKPGYATFWPMSMIGVCVASKRLDLVPGADRGHEAVLDEECLGDGRIGHRDDPPDDDEADASGADADGATLAGGDSSVDGGGAVVALGVQPVTRASATSAARAGTTRRLTRSDSMPPPCVQASEGFGAATCMGTPQ